MHGQQGATPDRHAYPPVSEGLVHVAALAEGGGWLASSLCRHHCLRGRSRELVYLEPQLLGRDTCGCAGVKKAVVYIQCEKKAVIWYTVCEEGCSLYTV